MRKHKIPKIHLLNEKGPSPSRSGRATTWATLQAQQASTRPKPRPRLARPGALAPWAHSRQGSCQMCPANVRWCIYSSKRRFWWKLGVQCTWMSGRRSVWCTFALHPSSPSYKEEEGGFHPHTHHTQASLPPLSLSTSLSHSLNPLYISLLV